MMDQTNVPRSGRRRVSPWWLLLLLLLYLPGQWHGLWGNDEPREAEIAREMYASGDWVVPRLNGVPFLEKPPLAHWSAALVFRALGSPAESWCRLSSALWGLAGALAAAWLGAMIAGPFAGILSAFILTTCAEWLYLTHMLLVDVPLAACVALSWALFRRGYGSPPGAGKRLCALGFWLAAGGAFMAKGAVGASLSIAPIAVFLSARREWREFGRLLQPLNVAAFAVLILAWPAALYLREGGGALNVFLWDNQVLRFVSPGADHAGPPWFYVPVLFEILLPWTIYLPAALWKLLRKREGEGERDRHFLLALIAVPLLLLSIASGKRQLYLLPVMPALAVALAWWLAGAGDAPEPKWERALRHWGFAVFVLLAPVGWAAALVFAIRGGTGIAAAVLGLTAAVSASAFALPLAKTASPRRMAALSAAFLGFAYAAIISPGAWKAVDADRGYDTLTGMLDAHAGKGGILFGYGPAERILGIVGFHRGAILPALWTPEELDRATEANPGATVLIPTKDYERLREQGLLPRGMSEVARCKLGRRDQMLIRRTGGP